MKTVATHSGTFHPDEVFAIAVLQLVYPNIKITRTRDPNIFEACDARVDVGNKYSFDTLDFDHHQKEGAGKRENGIPYASAGLVWKHFGRELVAKKEFETIDKKLFQPIDADDSGVKIYQNSYDISPYTIIDVINTFKPLWNETQKTFDEQFLEAVNFAKNILLRIIAAAKANTLAEQEVLSCIKEKEADYVILKQFCPYMKTIRENTQAKFVVFKGMNNEWVVRGIHTKEDTFEIRKKFPESWAGLRDEELAKVSGVDDAQFCHRELFICSARSYEGAIALVEKALRFVPPSE